MKPIYRRAILAAMVLHAPSALAAGAYFVDDADIVDPNLTQVESWYSHNDHDEGVGVINAARQLMPHTEVTIQEGHEFIAGDGNDTLSGQVKYQWWTRQNDSDAASSLVVGSGYRADENSSSEFYAYVPASMKIDENIDLNVDLGWQYLHDERRNLLTWGLGTELHADEALSFIGEIFGSNKTRPGLQVGSRYTLSPSLSLDAIYGHDITFEQGNWLTGGVTLTF